MKIEIKIHEDNTNIREVTPELQVQTFNEKEKKEESKAKSPIQIFELGLANILLKNDFAIKKVIEKSTGNIYLFKHSNEIKKYVIEWAKQKKKLVIDSLSIESEN